MKRAVMLEPITSSQRINYVLDSNVLIHDPNAILNFDEHHVVIPITVLEELDRLKNGKQTIAADCRQAIRQIDQILGASLPKAVEKGVPISRGGKDKYQGTLSILMHQEMDDTVVHLNNDINDNRIINDICQLKSNFPDQEVILVSKDINMRLKARGCGISAEDYNNDRQLTDISQLTTGYHTVEGSFWDTVDEVFTDQKDGKTFHTLPKTKTLKHLQLNEFIIDEQDFIGQVVDQDEHNIKLLHLPKEQLMAQKAWGLKPLDIFQALALHLLLDPDIHIVNLNGPAGSGKTILALAASIEMTLSQKQYRRIIATRSTKGLDEEIGYLPGTEQEKMEPWLGAITDNMEALHSDDESTGGSINYILSQVPIYLKSLNFIRGRSFQHSLIIIDECQNLTPHQMKTIITRAGQGSKVICLGNLAQIDTPYLNPVSSGLTYLTTHFRNFKYGGNMRLKGVPRSPLAAFAEEVL